MLNPNDARYYQGIIGGKTGYTSKAGNTLVTVAERNGGKAGRSGDEEPVYPLYGYQGIVRLWI